LLQCNLYITKKHHN